MPTIKFDTHITKANLTAMVEQAPTALMYGDNYAGVTYWQTDEGTAARAALITAIKAMRGGELNLTKDQAQLLRILVTVYKKGDGYMATAITDRNLPVIVALYNAGIRTAVQANTLPYYR